MDNTFLGLHQTGKLFNPTAVNFSIPSSGVEKLEIIAFSL